MAIGKNYFITSIFMRTSTKGRLYVILLYHSNLINYFQAFFHFAKYRIIHIQGRVSTNCFIKFLWFCEYFLPLPHFHIV